jgi:SAM-dependent methyltransferase
MADPRYDAALYRGSAPHYPRRPPYSPALVATVARELGLDGRGRLLDAGCGPGTLAIPLAPLFADAIGLDPDPEMLVEAERRARASGAPPIRWVRGFAEDIAALELGPLRLVTFGQSFHWTDRERVAEMVYDRLEPGGALAAITHAHEGRIEPPGPDLPRIPHDALEAIRKRYLGERRSTGLGFHPDRFEHALARTRFRTSRAVMCPGIADFVQDVEGVVSDLLSRSYCAPHLFGERLGAFAAEVRALLAEVSPEGRFREWPGDTQLLLAVKPAE